MRSRVIPHGSLANVGIDHGVHPVTDPEGAPFLARILREKWGFWYGLHNNLMCSNTLNRVIASRHFRDNGIVIVRIKPAAIPHLPARLRIERRVIENDFPRFARL